MQKVTSLIPIVVLLGLFSAGWIFLTGKSAFEFFTLLAFILAGIGLLAMVLLREDPKHFNFVLDKVSEIKNEGRDAFLEGLSKESNPYAGVDRELWDTGYDEMSRRASGEKKSN
ncbi:hypothetical protein [Vibrio parahaemolyticus]|uniref:hypothetical protein n=1 Tax=Vibrio parahaemolyticus TaxID=670 RepID=UPI0015DDDBED|nr:hypothetical protein [Vibrio parahaemolyticus]